MMNKAKTSSFLFLVLSIVEMIGLFAFCNYSSSLLDFVRPYSEYKIMKSAFLKKDFSNEKAIIIKSYDIQSVNSYSVAPNYSNFVQDISLHHAYKEIYPYTIFRTSSNSGTSFSVDELGSINGIICPQSIDIFLNEQLQGGSIVDEIVCGKTALSSTKDICIPVSVANSFINLGLGYSYEDLLNKPFSIINSYFSSSVEYKFNIVSVIKPVTEGYYWMICESLGYEPLIVSDGATFKSLSSLGTLISTKNKSVFIDYLERINSLDKTFSEYAKTLNTFFFNSIFTTSASKESLLIINNELKECGYLSSLDLMLVNVGNLACLIFMSSLYSIALLVFEIDKKTRLIAMSVVVSLFFSTILNLLVPKYHFNGMLVRPIFFVALCLFTISLILSFVFCFVVRKGNNSHD